jgi:hypothetical protein
MGQSDPSQDIAMNTFHKWKRSHLNGTTEIEGGFERLGDSDNNLDIERSGSHPG